MAILVHFKNNDFEYVEDGELNTLIEQEAIYAFKLASGWVQVYKGLTPSNLKPATWQGG